MIATAELWGHESTSRCRARAPVGVNQIRWAVVFGAGCVAGAVAVFFFTHGPTSKRFSIVPFSEGAAVWRLDGDTGEVSLCLPPQRGNQCEEIPEHRSRARATASQAPSSSLLVFPETSQPTGTLMTGFFAEWRGVLKQVLRPDPSEAKSRWQMDPEERVVGVRFELRDGQVAVRTWSTEGWRLVESSGQVLAPNHVTFSIERLHAPSMNEQVWGVDEIDATLVGGVIQCNETIRSYKTPGADPYETTAFVGILRPISKAESQALNHGDD